MNHENNRGLVAFQDYKLVAVVNGKGGIFASDPTISDDTYSAFLCAIGTRSCNSWYEIGGCKTVTFILKLFLC